MKKNKNDIADNGSLGKRKGKKGEEVASEPVSTAKKPVFMDMDDFDTTGLSITKSEPTPMPISDLAKAPAQKAVVEQRVEEPVVPVDSALLKPMPGGLQPIIAPKGQVQLNPVVVPVAFVPYSTQNQPLLQYEKRAKPIAGPQPMPKLPEISDQPLDKKAAKAAAKRDKAPQFVGEEADVSEDAVKKNKTKNRIFSAILFIVTLGFFAFVVLNFFATSGKLAINSPVFSNGDPDIIGGWMAWAKDFNAVGIVNQIGLIIFTVACVLALCNLIVSFISICNGKGYYLWINALLILIVTAAGTLLTIFVPQISGDIDLNPIGENAFAWRLVFVALLLLILSLCFMPRKVKTNKDEDYQADKDNDDLSDLF